MRESVMQLQDHHLQDRMKIDVSGQKATCCHGNLDMTEN